MSLGGFRDTREEGKGELDLGTPAATELKNKKGDRTL